MGTLHLVYSYNLNTAKDKDEYGVFPSICKIVKKRDSIVK